jgi:hypothetical protein
MLAVSKELRESFGTLAVVVHVLGLILFMAGILWEMRVLTLSLTPLEEEDAYLQTIAANRLARSSSKSLRITKAPDRNPKDVHVGDGRYIDAAIRVLE